jgi:hypothetical protein
LSDIQAASIKSNIYCPIPQIRLQHHLHLMKKSLSAASNRIGH